MPSPAMVSINGQLMIDMNDGTGTRFFVSDNDPLRASFGLFLPGVVPAANPTDVIVIQGSASKTLRIRELMFSGGATAASNVEVLIYRRTTANTGGTFTAQTLVNRDKSDLAATAVVNLYTANPASLGTSIGVADGGRLNLAPPSNGSIDRLLLQYGWLNDKAPILRGVSDFLCIGFGGVAWPAGGALDVNLVLTED